MGYGELRDLVFGIASSAIRADHTVRFFPKSHLVELIAIARDGGNHRLPLANLRSKDVVVIDDFGIAPIASRGNLELLDILDERIGVSPIIIDGQFPVST